MAGVAREDKPRAGSDLSRLPAAAAEQGNAQAGEEREGDGDGGVDAARAAPERAGEDEAERDLAQPEADQVEERRGEGGARAGEGRGEHHPEGVEGEAGADDPQRGHRGTGGVAGV